MSLYGTPILLIVLAVVVFAADIAWRIRKGKIGGVVSVSLAVLARLAFCGSLVNIGRSLTWHSRWVLPWLLLVLLWCLLDNWSERLKRPLSREARPGAV